jgi:hypothetical protein
VKEIRNGEKKKEENVGRKKCEGRAERRGKRRRNVFLFVWFWLCSCKKMKERMRRMEGKWNGLCWAKGIIIIIGYKPSSY